MRVCRSYISLLVLLFAYHGSAAQALLDRPFSFDARRKPVKDVLDLLGKKGNFSFSYNATMVPRDSLVTVVTTGAPLRQLLHIMFADAYQYKEVDNHIIILPAEKEKWFTISGIVSDAVTGARIQDVSVFERQELTSTLTNSAGFFQLRVKDKGRYSMAEIVVSKNAFYRDTATSLFAGFDQELLVTLTPANHVLPDILITQYTGIERSWLGKLLLSSQLRKQSANLARFFVNKPVQASFIPGIGTHGKLSSQVTNKASLNVLGGYAAGVNGFEIGGLFNIDKKDVQYVQVAGIFNVVSGSVTGVQAGGIANKVLKSVYGVQVGGIINQASDSVVGVQVSGIAGLVAGPVAGMQASGIFSGACLSNAFEQDTDKTALAGAQVSGIASIVYGDAKGAQISGIASITRGIMHGIQISSICNIARKVQGMQIGIINICDTIDGYSLGLVNIVKHGYHVLSIAHGEFTDINLAYKAGNKKLYSILALGARTNPDEKVFGYGIGIGTERRISRCTGAAGELTVWSLFSGNTENTPVVIRLEPAFRWHISSRFAIYAGPSFSFVPSATISTEAGYLSTVPSGAFYSFTPITGTMAWIGWHAGFHIF